MTEPIRLELPTMYGMKSVNAYLIKSPEPILIDCGEKSDATWEALQKALAAHQLTLSDIKKIIITHAHVDHIGMARKIIENCEAEVWVNEYCYDWAVHTESMWERRTKMMENHLFPYMPPNDSGNNFKKMLTSFLAAVMSAWDALPAERVQRFPIDGILNFGGGDWQVIYAPGHTNMQTCFYQPEKKWLIGADMLLSITPTPVIEFSREDYNKREMGLATMLQSYKKMRALAIDKVYPGHYEVFSNHQKLIDNQVRRIHSRKETTFELIQAGKHQFYELLETLYINRLSMPAMSMLRGYLDLLIEEQRIREEIKDGRATFYEIKN